MEACKEEKEEQITIHKSRLCSDSAQSILVYSRYVKQIIELRQHYKNSLIMLSETIFQTCKDEMKSKAMNPIIIKDFKEEKHLVYMVPDPSEYMQLESEEI